MRRITFQTGSYGVNCSILSREGDGAAWIVDPGAEGEKIAAFLENAGLRPEAILLTHAHFDHIGAIPFLQSKFPSLPVYVNDADRAMFGHPFNANPPDYPQTGEPADLRPLKDGGEFAGGRIKTVFTPGHSPGSVCYALDGGETLLTGDTLFAGSAGRTDLPGGSMKQLMESLEVLCRFPDSATVVPGHGPETSIGAEKKSNPFLWDANKEEVRK